ncbi:hypothetical protein N8A98_02455 (plasmid) [Devosia neptuniae]|uniref:Uncharacterized protein n=1 Tax=Devosia neptuniae TaxID=191302 RepID=A0ABY6C6P0_9HYPH|nr:hypothetical protein [Devosia neptuniae]UXN67935.1 hypothetical protein N8A98_02455 [Devosia neptuniae]
MISDLVERDAEDPLRQLAEGSEYVVSHVSKTVQIRGAIPELEKLGVAVVTSGREGWQDKLEGVNVVFLDWRLGQEGDRDAAIEAAVQTAKAIRSNSGGTMIVLMSSDPTVKSHARDFSERSGLIAGLFDAMPKAWLKDSAGLKLQMVVLGEHLKKGRVVQEFVDAVSGRAVDAIGSFLSSLRNLTLSDYANLQHFALKHDGHPLGDYLNELLAGVWVDALFQGPLRENLRALDREDFESLPSLMEPSGALTSLYNAAVFDLHVGGFAEHPHAAMAKAKADVVNEATGPVAAAPVGEPTPAATPPVGGPNLQPPLLADEPAGSGRSEERQVVESIEFKATGHQGVADDLPGTALEGNAEGKPRLSLSLGDVILETDGVKSRAYIVINPQCDLAESPLYKRQIDDEHSIFLVPGAIVPLDTAERAARKETADTPFFHVGDVKGRVHWDGKKQLSVPYGEFSAWMDQKARRRAARMRAPYALALQTAVHSDLTRVGLPAPPPLFEPMTIEVYKARMGQWIGDTQTREQGRLLMARASDSDHMTLTQAFLSETIDWIMEGLAALEGSDNGKDVANAAKIRAVLDNPHELQKISKPFKVEDSEVVLLGGAIRVGRTLPKTGFDRKLMVFLALPQPEKTID